MSIDEIVVLAQKGDDNAFYELISLKKEILYKTAYTYVKNREDALDIVQEVVCKAYISIKKLKEPKFFNTWIIRILINCCLDFLKKNKKTIELIDNITEDKEAVNENKEEIIDLYNSLDKLNEKYKTIVILKYFQGLTLQEIADVLNYPLGTAKTYLHKALVQLRLELKEDII